MRSLRIIAIILILLGAGAVGVMMALLQQDTIYPGVHVAGTDVGGLTESQAESKLASVAEQKARKSVTIRCEGKTFNPTLGEIGWQMPVDACMEQAYGFGREGNVLVRLRDVLSARRKGVELHVYTFSKQTATRFLEKAAESINRLPRNARLEFNAGAMRPIPEVPGLKLDIEKSRERMAEMVDAGPNEFDLVTASLPPEVTTADFKGIDGVIASYSTPYKPWERDRTYNLKIACKAINGTLIKSGEVFSYNKTVGPRLKEYGFRDALMFVDGQVETGTGGGVCQVSTTVYNAALLSNLQILRRTHHSRPVVYAPVGRDATVAYPAIDLEFKNTTDAPIYIVASVGAKTVNVAMLGKKSDGMKIELQAVGHRVIAAAGTDQVETPGLEKPIVKEAGRAGHQVSIYRIVKEGGEIVKRELISKDYYPPERRIIAIPASEPDAQPEHQ